MSRVSLGTALSFACALAACDVLDDEYQAREAEARGQALGQIGATTEGSQDNGDHTLCHTSSGKEHYDNPARREMLLNSASRAAVGVSFDNVRGQIEHGVRIGALDVVGTAFIDRRTAVGKVLLGGDFRYDFTGPFGELSDGASGSDYSQDTVSCVRIVVRKESESATE